MGTALTPEVSAFLNLIGADDALSVMIGGVAFVATWKSLKLICCNMEEPKTHLCKKIKTSHNGNYVKYTVCVYSHLYPIQSFAHQSQQ